MLDAFPHPFCLCRDLAEQLRQFFPLGVQARYGVRAFIFYSVFHAPLYLTISD